MAPRRRNGTTVTVTYTANEDEYEVMGTCFPGTPGRTSGDPDSCYPDEPGEAEVTDVTLDGHHVNVEEFLAMDEVDEEELQNMLLEAADFGCGYDEGPDPDAAYDSRFDRD